MHDQITLAGADTLERQTLAAIVADLSRPDSTNYQLRSVYDGPWVVGGEGPWAAIRPGEVYLSALWAGIPTAVWISSDGSIRLGRGTDLSHPGFARVREIIAAYQSAQTSRRAA